MWKELFHRERERETDSEIWNFIMLTIILLLWLNGALSEEASLAKPHCPIRCGSISIPYPFGIGANCSLDSSFSVVCNDSHSPPKLFFESLDLEVLQISLEGGTVHVNHPIITSNCPGRATASDSTVILSGPFTFSDTYNRFTAMGCDNLALLRRQATIISGCLSICNISSSIETGCNGINCCQTSIPPSLKFLNASLGSVNRDGDQNGCKYAFLVDQKWFIEEVKDIDSIASMEYVPAVLDWRIRGECYGNESNSNTRGSCGNNAYCRANQTTALQCFCERGYYGNPYLPSGCQDIDECTNYSLNRCDQGCTNTKGSYKCLCRPGYVLLGNYSCFKLYSDGGSSRKKVIVIGTCTGLGVLILLLGVWWFWNVIKRRRETKLKERFFKRNGGLLLQQQVSSDKGNVEANKLFTSKELEQATDNYNMNRILGQGGQGTVYKGMLTDGKIVAIKKSKKVDENQLEQFINEVVILSQINHRNVVKLLGCCLETEVPMLVYEFIPNGTLFHYIHNQNEEFPLTWESRLQIAAEVAVALAYLHSAAAMPIYHRDIKTTNILLDDKYRAKVSDFGTSRSIPVDQTHLTTLVQGTFGYLDPEYFQSNHFTEKSDVYSFGVVLVELLTGQKPILPARSDDEGRSLAAYFILAMKENRLNDILDARVVKEGRKEEILAVAIIAKRCLNMIGRKRPTMKEVVMELEGMRMSNGALTPVMETQCEEDEYSVDELAGPCGPSSSSTGSFFSGTPIQSSDVMPLL
ncbi:wall-associated receptor kinase-like 8 isoform X1 [Diospyros lotus]|uniref:wall-associated receptor kinase-like 8 isoform X1 n=1 Tax=Diospyros lotus TaxID=55363 RepID=UPI0022553EB1|nr:wall-associated receptor kinase-like 8 isoform X1 [Diospyros lotus]